MCSHLACCGSRGGHLAAASAAGGSYVVTFVAFVQLADRLLGAHERLRARLAVVRTVIQRIVTLLLLLLLLLNAKRLDEVRDALDIGVGFLGGGALSFLFFTFMFVDIFVVVVVVVVVVVFIVGAGGFLSNADRLDGRHGHGRPRGGAHDVLVAAGRRGHRLDGRVGRTVIGVVVSDRYGICVVRCRCHLVGGGGGRVLVERVERQRDAGEVGGGRGHHFGDGRRPGRSTSGRRRADARHLGHEVLQDQVAQRVGARYAMLLLLLLLL